MGVWFASPDMLHTVGVEWGWFVVNVLNGDD